MGKLVWEHYNPKLYKPEGLTKGFKKKEWRENRVNSAAHMAKPCEMCTVSDT